MVSGYDNYGDMACIAAGNSDYSNCGTIQSTNWSGYAGGVYQYNMRQASYSSIGGDSGSTIYGMYYGNWYIMGVHCASGGVYTHVQNAWEALGFTPIVEP